jgi:DNA polymerase-3 subunit epsilon
MRDYLRGFCRLDIKKPIAETDFVAFDMETTGFHAKRGDRIVSISALRLRAGRIDLSDAFHALVNPNRDIPSASAVIHGILPRMVNGKPTFAEVLPDFISYVGSAVLVGHHAWLDLTFLNAEMVRLWRFPIQNFVLDTALLDQSLTAKKIVPMGAAPSRMDRRLTAVAERYRVSVEERHTSFGDALATAEIFQNMLKQMERRGIVSLKDLLKIALTPGRDDALAQEISYP